MRLVDELKARKIPLMEAKAAQYLAVCLADREKIIDVLNKNPLAHPSTSFAENAKFFKKEGFAVKEFRHLNCWEITVP